MSQIAKFCGLYVRGHKEVNLQTAKKITQIVTRSLGRQMSQFKDIRVYVETIGDDKPNQHFVSTKEEMTIPYYGGEEVHFDWAKAKDVEDDQQTRFRDEQLFLEKRKEGHESAKPTSQVPAETCVIAIGLRTAGFVARVFSHHVDRFEGANTLKLKTLLALCDIEPFTGGQGDIERRDLYLRDIANDEQWLYNVRDFADRITSGWRMEKQLKRAGVMTDEELLQRLAKFSRPKSKA